MTSNSSPQSDSDTRRQQSRLSTPRNRWSKLWHDERAQTVEDYALGMAYFLITALFVFAFLGSISLPYESFSGDSQDIRGERVATTLLQDTLTTGADGKQPTTLNPDCTTAFFTNQGSACGYTPGDINNQFTTLDGDSIYIEIAEPDAPIAERSDSAAEVDGVTLYRGEPPYQQMRSATTERVVYLNGDAYLLRVVIQ